MTKTTDVLIAGGGVIGCALAYYLQLVSFSPFPACLTSRGE
jgi:L-2-hydroxyglutarate oxidase LhgO